MSTRVSGQDEACHAVNDAVCAECDSDMTRQTGGRTYTEEKISYSVECASGHTGVIHITESGTVFDGAVSDEEYLTSDDDE